MTTAQRKSSPKPAGVAALPMRRFTVTEYYAMVEAGILKKEDRVELIDGVIVVMDPIGNRHLATVDRYTKALVVAVGDRAIVRVQGSITLDDQTMPEPDLALLRERADFYESRAAGSKDVLLVIEVADSSVEYDRSEKLPRYAQAGIPEVWITVLPERIIETHLEPSGGRYTHTRIFVSGDTITPDCFPDIELRVNEILPG